MQKIATKIFIGASIAFGVIGILMVTVGSGLDGERTTGFAEVLDRLFQASIFVILPSFALSLAGKYLKR